MDIWTLDKDDSDSNVGLKKKINNSEFWICTSSWQYPY